MQCLHCDLPDLLEASRPPDPELVDLIEQAFIQGQIDRQNAGAGLLVAVGETQQLRAEMLPQLLP